LLEIAALHLHGSFLVEKSGVIFGGGDVGLSTELLDISALHLRGPFLVE
jgi:hypothetical protein